MTRVLRRIVHNWPLKLAAVVLASLMYGGLALSQNTQIFPGPITAQFINEPKDTVVLPSTPPTVSLIRYFAPNGVAVASSSFLATVDLSGLGGKVGLISVPIDVTSPDPRIRVLGFEPTFVPLELDRLVSKPDVPVTVVHGVVPDGLNVGTTTVDPPTVTVSGAASIVAKVQSVRADVIIQSTGINVDEDVQLVPVDALGNPLRPLEVTPQTARVRIPVFSNRQSRTLPVNPVITGAPAAGFEIGSVTVAPQVVLVTGDAATLAQLTSVDTDPIPLTGLSGDETVQVGLALPTGVVQVDTGQITVTVSIRPVTGTRTFNAGLKLVGASNVLGYAISTDRVLVTIGGSTANLDRLEGAALVMELDVTGLKVGVHDVPVTANLPAGTTLVAASPATITVTISAAPASPVTPASPPSTSAPSG